MSTVTIVTRTRNRRAFLARALDSVLAQTYSAWEHIIVNDGGDASPVDALVAERAEPYEGRCRVLHLDPARGMQEAANAGIAAGSGTYVVLHDDDDTWAPGFLAAAVGFLEDAGPGSAYQGVITATELVEERIADDGGIQAVARRPYIPLSEISLIRAGYENPFPPIAFCYRRTAHEILGGYDARFGVAGDYDFNLRFLLRYEIGVLPDTAAHYHVRVAGESSETANSVQAAAAEHKRRFNEIQNRWLREQDGSAGERRAGAALNLARYLVEAQWVLREIQSRTGGIEERTARLEGAVEQHAGNLWKEIQDRSGEIHHRLEENHRRLEGTHHRLEELGREATLQTLLGRLEELGREATLQTLLGRLEQLQGDLLRTGENLWTDLNARGREHTAALQEAGGQQQARLESLQESNAKLEARLEGLQRELAGFRAETTAARAGERALVQLGPLRLTWKRAPRDGPPPSSPPRPNS